MSKMLYKIIIIDNNDKVYKKIYKTKPPIHRDSKRKLPKNVKKMYSFAYMMRIMDYTLEEYNQLPEWKYK